MKLKTQPLAAVFSAAVTATGLLASAPAQAAAPSVVTPAVLATQVKYGTINFDGLNIAYREAGDPKNPKLVLLHGWPSSSHQYRNLIAALASRDAPLCRGVASPGTASRRDVAELIAFLVSPGARWITGMAVRVDGGETRAEF